LRTSHGQIVHSLDYLLESHPDIPFAFAEKVAGVSVPIHGITTNARVLLGNKRGTDPINKKLINLLAIGGQTDGALGLMPSQVDAKTLFDRNFLILLHIARLFLLELLEWELEFLATASSPV
jgi:hypothetical protein